MKLFFLLLVLLVACFSAKCQNLDSMDVETRDIDDSRSSIREKRRYHEYHARQVPKIETTKPAGPPAQSSVIISPAPVIKPVPVVIPQPIQPQVVIPQLVQPSIGLQHHCYWAGTSPFCMGHCGSHYKTVVTDSRGDGKKCWTGNKKFCCPRHGVFKG